MASMRAFTMQGFGGPEVLAIDRVPMPVPEPGEVRVRVRAYGINRADLLQRRGLYPAPPGVPADIPGLEYAGRIDAVGPEVEGVTVGDRVMGIVGGGSYAEYLVTPAAHTLAVPGALSFTQAAAIPEVFVTAHDALERLRVAADEWVLVHAVGSGVGTAALQLINVRGARCIGTSRTADKLKQAAAIGLEYGIDTSKEDVVIAVRQLTGDGVHAVLDLIGGATFSATLDALARRGRLVLVGITAGSRADVDLATILRKRLTIEGTVLRSRTTEEKTAVIGAFRDSVLPLFSANRVRPVIDRVFPFQDTPQAHEYMESNANLGKIVVEVG